MEGVMTHAELPVSVPGLQERTAKKLFCSGNAETKFVLRRKKRSTGLSDLALAMAYVPWQEWREIYDLEKGFCCGTIFRELHKPFLGAGGRR